jgi:hypothetical protein
MCQPLADVLRVVRDLAENMPNRGMILNERYLHHAFSPATPPAHAAEPVRSDGRHRGVTTVNNISI